MESGVEPPHSISPCAVLDPVPDVAHRMARLLHHPARAAHNFAPDPHGAIRGLVCDVPRAVTAGRGERDQAQNRHREEL